MSFKEKLPKYDKLKIGLLFGLLLPVLTLVIVFFYTFHHYTVHQFLHFLYTMRVMTKLFSLCVLPNLAVFYIFLKLNMNRATKGVLMSTFILAIIIVIIQFAIGAI